ncbi:MAG: sulfite exporter TauE/SafE family protein [Candidatus Aminicenantia bacterium]
MDNITLTVLLSTAFTLGLVHTLIGPDHYLPFILLARARNWKIKKTLWITFICGVGHVLSSVLIGLIGIAAGIAVASLEGIEGIRGNLASWALIAFGLVYGVWGLRRGLKKKPHVHSHLHINSSEHTHNHIHEGEHSHLHIKKEVTIWTLFIIFVLGPCEPLIPLVMYPAAHYNWLGVGVVTFVFGVVTVGTMMVLVGLSSYGLLNLRIRFMERFVHALAGGIIALSGIAIKVLGI